MNFKNPTLETIFKAFKWARNNTLQIFEEAQKNDILDYRSKAQHATSYTFQPLSFQFQCIISTTDTYYRKLSGNKNQQFGILVQGNKIIEKKDIASEEVKKLLQKQLQKLQNLLKDFDEQKVQENIDLIMAISNHEYLHQGQMIVDFREAGVELPERYKKAWAL